MAQKKTKNILKPKKAAKAKSASGAAKSAPSKAKAKIKPTFLKKNSSSAKVPKTQRKGVVNEVKIKELIEKSRQRGFITYTEILYEFPDIQKDIEGLEDLYGRLEDEGIKVEEVREYLTIEKPKEGTVLQPDLNAPLDPIQMYLKEIGTIEILKVDNKGKSNRRVYYDVKS